MYHCIALRIAYPDLSVNTGVDVDPQYTITSVS
jgi:hypothetical protein